MSVAYGNDPTCDTLIIHHGHEYMSVPPAPFASAEADPTDMVKLLICLFSAVALAICVLQLRQQRMELAYQNAELHAQIRGHQSRLWDQQLQIATFTAPNAIAQTVEAHDLKMVPRTKPLQVGPTTKPSVKPGSTRGTPRPTR